MRNVERDQAPNVLKYAVLSHDLETLKLCLENGKERNTLQHIAPALDAARNSGWTEGAKLLEEYYASCLVTVPVEYNDFKPPSRPYLDVTGLPVGQRRPKL